MYWCACKHAHYVWFGGADGGGELLRASPQLIGNQRTSAEPLEAAERGPASHLPAAANQSGPLHVRAPRVARVTDKVGR